MAKTNRRKQLRSVLLHFYEKPAAKVSLELFLSIGLIVFLGIFAIRPTLITMSDLLKEIEDKQEHNELLERKAAALSSAQNEFRRVESQLHLLSESIPENPELIYNLKLIEKTAVDNNVVLQNISLSKIPPEENGVVSNSPKSLTNLPVNVTIVGDYLSIRSFVESFHENRRAVIIDSVTFSLNDNNDTEELSARIALSFPYIGIESGEKK